MTFVSNKNNTETKLEKRQSQFLNTALADNKFQNLLIIGMGSLYSKMASNSKLHKLFDLYKDKYEDSMLVDGIERMCFDLHVPPEDFRILVLAWKLRAKVMCRFTRAEFVTGLRRLGVYNLRELKARLPDLVKEVAENFEKFKNLYSFTFKFGLDSGERSLPTATAVALWRVVFTVREPPILQRWLNFLLHQKEHRGISKDAWEMFMTFANTFSGDLNAYDNTEAWPTIFDSFVEYEMAHENAYTTEHLKKNIF